MFPFPSSNKNKISRDKRRDSTIARIIYFFTINSTKKNLPGAPELLISKEFLLSTFPQAVKLLLWLLSDVDDEVDKSFL
jgi:hypothetical protein